jgi:ketosteroid isomerase-like protein
MTQRLRGLIWGLAIMAIAIAVALFVGPGVWGQKKTAKQPKPPLEGQPMPAVPMPAADQIDNDIGEMLGAFQVGDLEAMHKHYADNATFVSGAYEPPIIGWQNYAAGYEHQRAAFQGMQLIRRNTIVFPHGDIAWASYQWEFFGNYNDKPYSARGQTTLVLNKVNDKWLIVHNHTSQICEAHTAPAHSSSAQPAAQNPGATAPKP